MLKRLSTTISRIAVCAAPTLVLFAGTAVAWQPSDPAIADLCDRAAAIAARQVGVPYDVLRAISLTETGRRIDGNFAPWPWTVNMEGEGRWFASRDEALAYTLGHQRRGARSFDAGCFQVNHRWHGRAFDSVEAMFDPVEGAIYAARFLSDLHTEFGSWSRAAGAYHSRTPELAARYRARFDRIRARLEPNAPPEAGPRAEPSPVQRTNTFPLLASNGAAASRGSLFPGGIVPGRRLIDPGALR